MKTILIDTFGADSGEETIILGAYDALLSNKNINITLVGDEARIRKTIGEDLPDNLQIIHTTDYIKNTEPPTVVFNGREKSSTVLSLSELKNNPDAMGLLSAGSTGALLVGSIIHLGLKEGLKSPVLSCSLPQKSGKHVCLLDCGANIDCTARDFVNFALLGKEYAEKMYGIDNPRIALLSVGREKGKGTPLITEAFSLLSALPINFVGNLEGCDLQKDEADVLVCDGYAGNLMLKSTEAAGIIAMDAIKKAFEASPLNEASKALYDSACAKLVSLFDFNTKGGATFLGTKKPIIKMHGAATRETVSCCVAQLLRLYA